MEPDLILSFFRGGERLLIVFFGGLSLYLGWSLFKNGVNTEQRAEFKNGNFSVTLQKVGPGVFFALFGAIILWNSTNNVYSNQSPNERDINYKKNAGRFVYFNNTPNKNELYLTVQALNTVKSISEDLDELNHNHQKGKLVRAVSNLNALHNEYLRLGMGDKQYQLWLIHGENYIKNRSLISDSDKLEELDDASRWINNELQ